MQFSYGSVLSGAETVRSYFLMGIVLGGGGQKLFNLYLLSFVVEC